MVEVCVWDSGGVCRGHFAPNLSYVLLQIRFGFMPYRSYVYCFVRRSTGHRRPHATLVAVPCVSMDTCRLQVVSKVS